MNAQTQEIAPAMSPEACDLSRYYRNQRSACQSRLRGKLFLSEYTSLRARIAHYTNLIRALEGQS
ncbi:hypothetical protein [Dinoroseobacter sp. S375]|uniref:hypothetical protein n=1 Tax=Dinoroseobacter sp. S375 TaxID=3415136 RepID=UPI003C7A8CE7